ncbi:ABC transporter substrate-binding protein [Rhizobium sp. SYY.PMSO]|uniref:ABC transporter substrate-binding protein n=1 Tax=Rhizobium sp. SYY.PMSO TaxID=3382192 RepID=UPI00398FB443
MPAKHTLLTSSIFVAAALFGTSASAQSKPSTSCATTGGTMVVAMPADILRSDPTLASDTQIWYIAGNVLQGLMGPKPGQVAELEPVLAKSLPDISADGTVYKFQLREGVTFHDGTPFNAAAVKYNFDRWTSLPKELQPYAPYTAATIGFGANSIISAVKVTGDYSVEIDLKKPNSSFLDYLALAGFSIASPTALKAGGADNTVTDISKIPFAQGGPTALVGTGPFKFKEWAKGDHLTITRNDKYWDKAGIPCLDQVVFRPISNPATVLNGLQAGDIDVAFQVGPGDVPIIKANPKLQIVERGDSCNMFQLALNNEVFPFNDPRVRRAIAYAIDKDGLIDGFYGGYADAADGFLPPAFQYAKLLGLPKYDPEKAKKLLAETGYTPDQLKIQFWYPSNVVRPYMPDASGEFQAIAANLEAVGFKVEPKSDIWSPNYLDAYVTGRYPMYLMGTICQWASADNFLLVNYFGYVDGKPRKQWNYKNDALQAKMEQALAAPNTQDATKFWGEAQDMLGKDLPIIPLVNAKPPAAAQTRVRGFVSSGNLREQMNTVWLAKN